jgi:pimeloyl-ACP methyl ester carboxylesterase
VLVHGAWHRKEMWNGMIGRLRLLVPDLDIHTPQNPSSAPVPPGQLGGLLDDARVIRDTVARISGPVVVVAHSYGAVPTTTAFPGPENVKRIVYISGFPLDAGESMAGLFGGGELTEAYGGADLPYFWGRDHYADGYYEMLDAENVFYNDLSPQDQKLAVDALTLQSRASVEERLTQAAWRTIPTTYIMDTNDNAVPVEVQKGYAARCQRVHHIASSHSPFLSRPAELAAILLTELVDAADTVS